jgi:hypothetical protein
MRAVAVVLAGSLVAGCATDTYRIPISELTRLAHTPPEQRGQRVRVVQEALESDIPSAPTVGGENRLFFFPYVEIDGSIHTRREHVTFSGDGPHGGFGGGGRGGHGGGHGGGGHFGNLGGGSGGDGKGAAIVVLVIAATVLITAAAVEAARFDGFVQLHPMHPVHLVGKDGSFDVVPLAYLNDDAVAWTDIAIISDNEGPWHPLERAPLDRHGATYSMYGGFGSLRSAAGDLALGPAWTLQLGGFATPRFGIVASVFFGWRDNRFGATLFESQYTAEAQYFPVQVGRLHAGLFGGAGVAQRFEDAIAGRAGDDTSLALDGGAMLQLDINTRIALTARLGATFAHDEQMHTALFGLSVY